MAAKEFVAGTAFLDDPTSATFAGTPPNVDPPDTDNDGLPDHVGQRGWTVTIRLTNGREILRRVTSDPASIDTDNDGLTDEEELQYGTDPRAIDTDGDTLPDAYEFNVLFSDPTNQDTDGDGIDDGLEHNFFRTSPILADTDGDQNSDAEELLELNRNPRIADLPRLRVTIGNVRLQIDERFTFTDEQGNTVSQESHSNTTLARSEDRTFSRGDEHIRQVVGGFDIGVRGGISDQVCDACTVSSRLFVQAEFTGHFERTTADNWTTTAESAIGSQRVYEQSLTKGRTFTTSSAVAREVVGARIDVDLTLENEGNIAFTVSNLEVTVLQPSPLDTGRLIPVATLIPNTTLITGAPAAFNLGGTLANQRGPFIFASRDVLPTLVEALLKNPRGLIFKVANFDLTDEFGRNFAFSSQTARDRTIGVTVDFGEAEPVRQLVAASGAIDSKGFVGGGFVGGFDENGKPKGLPLDFILQDILGYTKNNRKEEVIFAGPNGTADSAVALGSDDLQVVAQGTTGLAFGTVIIRPGADGFLETLPAGDDVRRTSADGIIAGLNKIAESIAQGDDLQVIPPGTTGVGVGSIVVAAGANGVLDSVPRGDDQTEVTSGYETSLSCSSQAANAGALCTADADCLGGGTCSGPERLVRVGSRRSGDFGRAWVTFSTGQIPVAANFGQIVLQPGQDVFLAFLQDLDRDGLFAREEFLAGSIDSAADRLVNANFGEDFDDTACTQPPVAAGQCDGIADSQDTDRDGLGDFTEVRIGWTVSVDGSPLVRVYPSPRRKDSDGDGLSDLQEMDLRKFCVKDDLILGSLCREPASKDKAEGIIAGKNGRADTIAAATDEQLIAPGTTGLAFASVVVGPGEDGTIETNPSDDDEFASSATIPPATDPTRRDTDADGVDDGDELLGYTVALAIVENPTATEVITAGNDRFANTAACFQVFPCDDVQVLPPGTANLTPDTVIIHGGPNRKLETLVFGDDDVRGPTADTLALGDDVQKVFVDDPTVAQAVIILPGPNGVLDSRPEGDDVFQAGRDVKTDPLRSDSDDDSIPDGVELALGSDPTDPEDGADFRDADQDGLTDAEELRLGWFITVDNVLRRVFSNPNNPDSDFDGLPDFVERAIRSDPNRVDTDGDSLSDFDEFADFERFASLHALFPGFVLDGSDSQRYGTNPTQSDTDGDGLRDDFELLQGYAIRLPGETSFRQVFTNPLLADTDFDGVSDFDEKNRMFAGKAAPTDATDPDSDDDGRTDGTERDTGTNPLVPDISITVAFQRIEIDQIQDPGGAEGAEFGWWFLVRSATLPTNPTLVSSAGDFFGNPLTDLRALDDDQSCLNLELADNRRHTLTLNKEITFPLSAGQTFVVEGLLVELDAASSDCGEGPNYIPTSFVSQCFTRFSKTFKFGDFSAGDIGGTSLAINPVEGTQVEGGDRCAGQVQATIHAR